MELLTEKDAVQKDILSLALVGDGVFSLFIRERLIMACDCKSGLLSKKCVGFVNAAAQCKMLYAIEDGLSETEAGICRRARNAHNNSKAKNASIDEYKKATALEALLGFLYLTGQSERLREIMEKCYGCIGGVRGEK
jgi:ribonuclease-3 family protein